LAKQVLPKLANPTKAYTHQTMALEKLDCR